MQKTDRKERLKQGCPGRQGDRTGQVDGVIYVEKNRHNLISIACLCKIGHTVYFSKKSCDLNIKRNIVWVGRGTEGKYAVNFKKLNDPQAFVTLRSTSMFERYGTQRIPMLAVLP